jgi:ketosteroid isomerase-like protein
VTEAERVVVETMNAWNANAWDRFDELWAIDAEIVTPPEWPEAGTFTGRDAVRAQFERLKDSWASDELELLSLESSGERALARVRWRGTGLHSEFPLDLKTWLIAEVRHGRNQRVQYFMDEESARDVFKRETTA